MKCPLSTRLNQFVELTSGDEQAFMALDWAMRHVPAHGELLREGDTPDAVHVILDGWAARHHETIGLKRQITALFLPGDICNPEQMVLKRASFSVSALTHLTVASVGIESLSKLVTDRPNIRLAVQRRILFEAESLRRWLATITGTSAYAATAHLICWLHHHLGAIGMVRDGCEFDLPLTQAVLGECLGLTGIHTNRMLLRLRSERLISLRHQTVIIHDLERLAQLGSFTPNHVQ